MLPRHALAALLLATVAALGGARRLWPERPPAPARCTHAFGVQERGAGLRLLCREGSRARAGLLLDELGHHGCGAGPELRAGEVLRLEGGCRGRVTSLPAATRLALGLPLELNRATAADLEALPGIGPKLARRILEERERLGGAFPRLAALRAVRGIGQATLERLRTSLCIEGAAAEGCER